jgi:hypothetical protein
MENNFELVDIGEQPKKSAEEGKNVLSSLVEETERKKKQGEKFKPELADIRVDELDKYPTALSLFNEVHQAEEQFEIDSADYESLCKKVGRMQAESQDEEHNTKDENLDLLFQLIRDKLSGIYLKVLKAEEAKKQEAI